MKAKITITIPEHVMEVLFEETEISTKEEAKAYLTAIWSGELKNLPEKERFGLNVEVMD